MYKHLGHLHALNQSICASRHCQGEVWVLFKRDGHKTQIRITQQAVSRCTAVFAMVYYI